MADHPLIGIWKLISLVRSDLEGNEITVDVTTGSLMYTPNGWMCEAFEFRTEGDGRGYVIYSGEYAIDGNTVIHKPLIHTNPEMIGLDLPRTFTIDGNRFTLFSPNPNGSATLVWERALG